MLGLQIVRSTRCRQVCFSGLEFQLEPFVTIVKFLPQIRFAFVDHAFGPANKRRGDETQQAPQAEHFKESSSSINNSG